VNRLRRCLYHCRCKEVNTYTLYPWVHQFSNNMAQTDQLRPVLFPDVSPSDMPSNANFSMAAGDFLEVYEDPGLYCTACQKALYRIQIIN